MRVNSRFKRYVTASATVLMSATGVVAITPQANANPPSGVNIRGKEPLDTDKFMDYLCSDGSTADKEFVFNVHTGEIHNMSVWGQKPYYNTVPGQSKSGYYKGPRGYHYTLAPGWEEFNGNCEFPVSSTWTWYASERRISNDSVSNCTKGTANLNVNESYATTRTTTTTVGAFTKISAKLTDIFGGELGFNATKSWSYSETHALGRTVGITVASGRSGWMDARPLMRTVRVNPVFKVRNYRWGDGHTEFPANHHTWRGRNYDRIWSYGYYIDGKADVINSDGTPAMDLRPRDKRISC